MQLPSIVRAFGFKQPESPFKIFTRFSAEEAQWGQKISNYFRENSTRQANQISRIMGVSLNHNLL